MVQPIQIPLPVPYAVGPVNSYLFLDPEPTLVDCGLKTDDCWQALVDGLAAHNLTVGDIRHVVITHAHVDHIGMAGKIVAHSDAKVWVSTLVKPWATEITEKWPGRIRFLMDVVAPFGFPAESLTQLEEGMRHTTTMWDPVPSDRIVTFALDDTLKLGGVNWDVIYTPGHCVNQTCFYQPESGQLLAADMLLPFTPTAVIEQSLEDDTERERGLPRFLDSLGMVEELEISTVYPGHGDPFTDYRGLIERQSIRISERTEQCYGLIDDGRRTFPELLAIMYPERTSADRFPALCMLLGYLDLLIDGGLVKGELADGVVRYRTTV